jgi:tetratricopeptide (TPR) repeat protein
VVAAAALAAADSARERFERAVELLKSGQDAEAAEAFRRTLEMGPEQLQVRVLYGLALFRSGRAVEGEQQARSVLAKEPANPQAQHLLGLCLLRQDKLEEGSRTLEQLLKAQPANVDAAATLATVYAGLGEAQKAEALLEGPLGKTERSETFLVRGVVQKSRSNWLEAAKALEQAIRLNPKLPTAHSELGHAYLLMGESDKAEEQFRKELELQPGDFHASVYLAWHYLNNRRYADALPLLDTAHRRKPAHPGVLYLLGQARQGLGEYGKAAEHLEAAVRGQPDFTAAHVLLARVYAKLGRVEEAKREQAVIARLRQEEQQRNLGASQGYGSKASVPQLEAR